MNQALIETYAKDDPRSAVHRSIPAHPRICVTKTLGGTGTADVKLGANIHDLWARLEELDAKIMDPAENRNNRPYKHYYHVADLSKRFDREARAKHEQRSLDVWGRSAQ